MQDLSQQAGSPDHPVWQALEGFFRTKLRDDERQRIVATIRHMVAHRPDINMNDLALEVTQSVLSQRARPKQR